MERLICVSADLATVEGCAKACAAALKVFDGKLDVLVNNVGGARLGCPIESASDDDFMWHFALNVRPCYEMVRCCRDALIKSKGAVINLSSIAASQVMHGMTPYCIAKAAIEHLTKCQANELTQFGVRVNAVAPGTISTEFHVRAGMPSEVATQYYKDPTGRHPLGRVGDPEEIADAIVFLASSSWTTGSVLTVDGGRQLLCGPESRAPQGGAKSKPGPETEAAGSAADTAVDVKAAAATGGGSS